MDLHHLSFFRNRITTYSILILYIHLKYSTSCAIKTAKRYLTHRCTIIYITVLRATIVPISL